MSEDDDDYSDARAALIASKLFKQSSPVKKPTEKTDSDSTERERNKKIRAEFEALKARMQFTLDPIEIQKIIRELSALANQASSIDGTGDLLHEINTLAQSVKEKLEIAPTYSSDQMEIDGKVKKPTSEFDVFDHLTIISKAESARKEYKFSVETYADSLNIEHLNSLKEKAREDELSPEELEACFYDEAELERRKRIQKARKNLDDSYEKIYDSSIAHHHELERLEAQRETLVQQRAALVRRGESASKKEAPDDDRALKETPEAASKDVRDGKAKKSQKAPPASVDEVDAELRAVDEKIELTHKKIEELAAAEKGHEETEKSLEGKLERIKKADEARKEIFDHQLEVCALRVIEQQRTTDRLVDQKEMLDGRTDDASIAERKSLEKQIDFHKEKESKKRELVKKLASQKKLAADTAIVEEPSKTMLDKKAKLAALERKRKERRLKKKKAKQIVNKKDIVSAEASITGPLHSSVKLEAKALGSISPPQTPIIHSKKSSKGRE